MSEYSAQKPNRKSNFFKRLAYWKKPSFKLKEEYFLVEKESFFTGLWRALRMFVEYMQGFYAFRHVNNCVTIFGSARFRIDHSYYQLGRELGKTLANAGFTVMTGGGPGLMQAANQGAKEANGKSIACNITRIALEEPYNPYVDKRITLRYFFVRKVMLTKYSSAFVALPGGLGTLDELFEMLTLIQTGKISNFPLVMMGKSYWSPLLDFMKNTLLENEAITQEDFQRILVTDSPEQAISYIKDSLTKLLPG
jgi:uncharacterized protein (TIGR00730 family)